MDDETLKIWSYVNISTYRVKTVKALNDDVKTPTKIAEDTGIRKNHNFNGHIGSFFDKDIGVSSCLLITDNYMDAVLKAVNLGSDTDTIAAICGGLAGIYYGYDSIPVKWVGELARGDDLNSLCKNYEEVLNEYF